MPLAPAQDLVLKGDAKCTGCHDQSTCALDRASSLRFQYQYRRLKSSDWAYEAYIQSALGVLAVQNFVGPAITSPNYDVNVVGVAYIYRFR